MAKKKPEIKSFPPILQTNHYGIENKNKKDKNQKINENKLHLQI